MCRVEEIMTRKVMTLAPDADLEALVHGDLDEDARREAATEPPSPGA